MVFLRRVELVQLVEQLVQRLYPADKESVYSELRSGREFAQMADRYVLYRMLWRGIS